MCSTSHPLGSPCDTEALLVAFERLRSAGNSLFVVEHDLDVIRRADWIVDVGPGAGEQGGYALYMRPPAGSSKSRPRTRDATSLATSAFPAESRVHPADGCAWKG